jgi:two-component system chemotaxis response regulator CheY
MKILVCDDESLMRDLNIGLLVENGISPDDIIEASNGNEALTLMDEHEIKLFLLDWNMPGLNGIDLVKRIRNTEKYHNTPIVMVTAEGGRYFIVDALEAGVTNYILKPVVANLFWEKVKPYTEAFFHSKEYED